MHITFAQAVTACNGTYYGSQNPEEGYFTSVTTDSRKAAPGVLFFAIKGERVDGHDFMEQVSVSVRKSRLVISHTFR